MRGCGSASGLLLLAAVTACSEPSVKGGSLLGFVPADSPYVIASGAPFPPEYLDKLRQIEAELRPILAEALADATGASGGRGDGSAAERASAELLMKISFGYPELGIREDSRFVLYGRGLYPTGRIETADPARASELLDQIAQQAGPELEAREASGQRYWRLDLGQLVLLMSVREGALIGGLSPRVDEASLLDHLLAASGSGSSEDIAARIEALRARHGLGPQAAGYLDSQKVLDIALDAYAEAGAPVAAACRDELGAMAQAAPQWVVGYQDVTPTSITGRLALELDDPIATELAEWSVPVPGTGDEQALAGLGLGIDAPKLVQSLSAWQRALTERASACGGSANLDPGDASKALIGLGMAGNPRGFWISLDEVATGADGRTRLGSSLLLQAESPQSLALIGAGFLPLGPLLRSAGKAVEIPIPEGVLPPGAPAPEKVWGILTRDAIGLTTSQAGPDRLEQLVAAAPPPPGTLLTVELDVHRLADQLASGLTQSLDQLLEAAGSGSEDLAARRRELERTSRMAGIYGQVIDRILFRLVATGQAIEVRETIQLR